jgi:uncharacterized protein YlaI
MRPTVRATCPSCGDVELGIAEVTVLVCTTTEENAYAFLCPGCERRVTKPTDSGIAEILLASGARLHRWQMPAELAERHDGPPLVEEDLLALREALEDPRWMDRLRAVEIDRSRDRDHGR